MKEYNIGLDIGTSSVGWAVVECDNQKIIQKGKNRTALWGVRLFDSANTAQERRVYRSNRRRYDRRRERINLLQKEFRDEINKVDINFFEKLKESKYNECDKFNKKIILPKEEKELIKEYNKKYPTIYHLRNELIENTEKKDIRLVYLALHHLIKYRGNFTDENKVFNISDINVSLKIEKVLETIIEEFPTLNIDTEYKNLIDLDIITTILISDTKNDIKIKLSEILNTITDNKTFIKEFVNYLLGYKFSINKMFNIEEDNEIKLYINGSDYEDKYSEIEVLLNDKIEIIDLMKELFDSILLKKLFKNYDCNSISKMMVLKYNEHKADLKKLKNIFSNNRDIYNQIFRTKKEICLYEKYIHNNIEFDEFIKELRKKIDKCDDSIKSLFDKEFSLKINNGMFLPRITDKENGIFPYQLNDDELIKIIKNQGNYYPFLLEKTSDDKYIIQKIMEFKIPYYVGPLNNNSKFSWVEKNSNDKITPYNFDEIINKDKTAEKFILRMISHCTYLLDEFALANNSIIYSKYKVLNELKQIRINGNKLSLTEQHNIFRNLFLKVNGKITNEKFIQYLNTDKDFSMYNGDFTITGYSSDNQFANNMQSYIDFFGKNGIFEDANYSEEDADNIITWVTIFNDKDILIDKIRDNYSNLSDDKINIILQKKYSGWGNLSKKLLFDLKIKDKRDNNYKSIMDLMYDTEENFMQIINNDEYNFQKIINEENKVLDNKKISYDLVEYLATSPATKKGIYQALKVVDEIVKYMGHDPKNIMIEMARSTENTGRKDSRKRQLIKLYENNKQEINNYSFLKNELDNFEEIDSQKLFLYFIQEGKCLYCGNSIDINSISSDHYEIDHIIPRMLIKDDSIDNKCLVCRECNQTKASNLVLPSQYNNQERRIWWNRLKKIGLISAKKFYNLSRKEYKDEDIKGFINRQLVETRQITKHVANILNNLYEGTKTVYVKANLSHNYREKFDLYKFREINDYHHAHDAYLAAVLGEYQDKYMKRDINFDVVKELNNYFYKQKEYNNLKYGYVINCLDNNYFEVINKITKNFVDEKTGEILFDINKFNNTIEKNIFRNDILISRKPEIRSGKLFKETINKAREGLIPLKKNMPTELYGGYTNVETSFMSLIKYKEKYKIIGVPSFIDDKNQYIRKQLKLKDNETYDVIIDKIPYEILINYEGQDVYIKGFSVAKGNNELCNARQLKISKDNMIKWKKILNILLNKNIVDDNFETNRYIYTEIVNYLYENKTFYPLVEKEIMKIQNSIDLNSFKFEDYKKLIIELLKIYHCDSTCGNLSSYSLGDRIGRLSGKTISSAKIINKSITGIKQKIYEF